MMKAVQIASYGSSEMLEITDVDIREPKPNQVQVQINSASINPFDVTLASGIYRDNITLTLPYIVGGDFSGTIQKLGKGVEMYKIGDQVFGNATVLSGGTGAFATYANANVENIWLKPSVIDFDQAAAFPLVGCSAVQALVDHINLQSNTKIFIHGGAGGIGHVAVQLASAIGAHVSTSVSTSDIQFVKDLGANGVIDYKTQDFESLIKEYDAIFDTVGGEVTNKSLSCLKKGGILVTMVGNPDEIKAKELGVTVIRQSTKNNSTHLQRLSEFIESGKVKVNIDKVFLIDQIKEAFNYMNEHHKGKIVIKIK